MIFSRIFCIFEKNFTMSDLRQISIRLSVYERLKEYCSLNKLKISDVASDSIHETLMNLMYGDIPFGTISSPMNEREEKEVEMEVVHIQEVMEEKKPEEEVIEEAKIEKEENLEVVNSTPNTVRRRGKRTLK